MDVSGFQLASKTPFRSAFEAVQLLTKVRPILYMDSVEGPLNLILLSDLFPRPFASCVPFNYLLHLFSEHGKKL